jgi:threonine dehydrogenase-like Zn-dependent dehydrogenase
VRIVKAVVWHDVGDIRLDEVPDPKILEPGDAIIRITRSAICGTDLHLVRGTMPGMVPGTVLGHEAVGVVEEVDLTAFVTRHEKPVSSIEAYETFDRRAEGWLKTVLDVG